MRNEAPEILPDHALDLSLSYGNHQPFWQSELKPESPESLRSRGEKSGFFSAKQA